jgi:DNA-binding response OmpR family regulator
MPIPASIRAYAVEYRIMRILIVEDEPRMLELLRMGLYEHGFTVMTAPDGETGLEIATAHAFDALVLDIGLPRMNGYIVMQTLRARQRTAPVLMLTARDKEDDIIRGFDVGADDYLTKPFSFPELVARLQSITRGHGQEQVGLIRIGDATIDLIRHSATRNGESIALTRLEFLLLACLARHSGRCVSRPELMETIWGPEHQVGPSALDVLVNSLRAKFDVPYPVKLIGTVRGSGYIMKHGSATAGSVAN